jgi:hypothetical protein
LREAQTPGQKIGKDADFLPRKGLKRKYLYATKGAYKIEAESPVSGALKKGRKCAL